MKKSLFLLISSLFVSTKFSSAQIDGTISGGYESFSQWYQNDKKTGINFNSTEARFLSNNYFKTDYTASKFKIGMQYEAYLPKPLKGYEPKLNGNGFATYYANLKLKNLDITAGYFYDQFGNGLIFRSWEDRQIGINNAIKGIRIHAKPIEDIMITALTGFQRIGFQTSRAQINGLNAELDLGSFLNFVDLGFKLGSSYIGRYINHVRDTVSGVNAYSGRFDINYSGLNFGAEVVSKDKDIRYDPYNTDGIARYDKGGSAILVNLGYSQKGLGVLAQYRRVENMGFYSDLANSVVQNTYNSQTINYLPSLTKQHDYNVTSIYVYQTLGFLALLI